MGMLSSGDRLNCFEYVSQDGNAQQWRSASQALEVVWGGTGFLSYLPSCTATVPAAASHTITIAFEIEQARRFVRQQ
jgi:hypothetical protein